MDTVNIRQAIAAAKLHERTTGQLAQQLTLKAGRLHHSIELPHQHIVPVLLNFIIRYVDQVPEFVEAVEAIGEEIGMGERINPIIAIAKEFFVQPPELINGHEGLNALMVEAYLAQRFIEEVNDRFIARCGNALMPMDMTRSNLIIHHLIGEPFANQLDEAVHLIAGCLEQQEEVFSDTSLLHYFYANKQDLPAWLNRWPCLVDALSLNFSIGRDSQQVVVH